MSYNDYHDEAQRQMQDHGKGCDCSICSEDEFKTVEIEHTTVKVKKNGKTKVK